MEIKFIDVSFSYNNLIPDNNTLKNINLNFEKGKIYGIVGGNGSGKTTLIKMINGLSTPTNGKITIGRYKIESDSKLKSIKQLRSNIGFLYQFPEEQFSCNTVKEEICLGMKNFNVKLDIIDKHTSDALKLVDLNEDILDRNPFSLSNGEKRKVAIAAALSYNPKIVILDDPTVSLDDKDKKNLLKIIRNLKLRYGKTVIIVSQDTDFLLKIVDEVVLIQDGAIALKGDKYTVLSNEKVLRKSNVKVPDILAFSNLVKKKKDIKLGYRDEINDLIKDIYRNIEYKSR